MQKHYWIIRNTQTGNAYSGYQQGSAPKLYDKRTKATNALSKISLHSKPFMVIEKVELNVVQEAP